MIFAPPTYEKSFDFTIRELPYLPRYLVIEAFLMLGTCVSPIEKDKILDLGLQGRKLELTAMKIIAMQIAGLRDTKDAQVPTYQDMYLRLSLSLSRQEGPRVVLYSSENRILWCS